MLGAYIVFMHAVALVYLGGLARADLAADINEFLRNGVALSVDAGWVIPLALGTIVTANVAMIGQSFLKRSVTSSSKDTIVLVALGTAGLLVAYTITVFLGLLGEPHKIPRAFMFVGFTTIAVVLAARTGTHFWGNPEAQLEQARTDHITIATRLAMLSPRHVPQLRLASAMCWVFLPALLLCNAVEADVHLFSSSSPLIAIASAAELTLIVAAIVWPLIHSVVFFAVVPSRGWRVAAVLSIVVLPFTGLSGPLVAVWNITGDATHLTAVAFAAFVVAAVLLPASSPFSFRYASEVFSRYRLRRQQLDAAKRIRRARDRVRYESEIAAA